MAAERFGTFRGALAACRRRPCHKLRKGVIRRTGRDDRAVGELVSGAVMVGHDHLEPELLRPGDLGDGRNPAVDGEHEAAPFVCKPVERGTGDPVTLFEPAREVPGSLLRAPEDENRGLFDSPSGLIRVDAKRSSTDCARIRSQPVPFHQQPEESGPVGRGKKKRRAEAASSYPLRTAQAVSR